MFSFALTLNPDGRQPMYEQLYRCIAEAIRSGSLRSGEKLPSKRELCEQLGISRSTVETAYELLRAEGYVEARPRSGFYTADYLPLPGPEHRGRFSVFTDTENRPLPPESPFSTSAVDVSAFPYASWAKLYKEVVYNSPDLLQRGEPQGEPRLRTALTELLSEYRGVRCTPDQIVVGSGIETLMSQVVTILGPETVWALEDPGYPAIDRTLRARGSRRVCLPLDGDGMDAEALERSGADVAYLTPSHQFPLGITMPASRRSRLLRWASGGDRYIVEDDYDSEFRYGGRPIPAMQGLDRLNRVIYVGTFSRSLAPAIRLAYMVLPPVLLERWQALFGRQQPTVSRSEQTVMARFLAEGWYGRYLRRVGKLYADRRAALLTALGRIDGVRISGADGGIHFLLTNPRLSEKELVRSAGAAGLRLTGLSEFCSRVPPEPSTLVIGFGGLPTEEVSRAVSRMEAAWEAAGRNRAAGGTDSLLKSGNPSDIMGKKEVNP